MASGKIPHLLLERGRYYYQRKVPLSFHDVVGTKKWRQPLGPEYLPAVDRARELTKVHNALLLSLTDPEMRRDQKTETRRNREVEQIAKATAADETYRQWLTDNDRRDPEYFGEDSSSLSLDAEARERPWESAAILILHIEDASKRDRPQLAKTVWHFGDARNHSIFSQGSRLWKNILEVRHRNRIP